MTSATWHVDILTLFPEMFPGPLGHSIAGKALEKGLWSLKTHDIRAYGEGTHKVVDDTPCGGGPGMVMKVDVLDTAISGLFKQNGKCPIYYLSPRGKPITQKMIKTLAKHPQIALLCGRYEGVDERLFELHDIEEISLGDFILSGGELPALSLIDACVRLLPGVMGAETSADSESFEGDLLEYPHYTRPRTYKGFEVPEILLSGDHAKIDAWRQEKAEEITKTRRPDLWERVNKAR